MCLFTWSDPKSIKRSWETGHLRGVGSFAWGSAFTGRGRKIGWGIVLTIWLFCYGKNGVGNQIVVGGILLVGKMIEFLATAGDHNPPVGKIVVCTLNNHDLFFIIFYNLLLKNFESMLWIINMYLVMNIWKYIIEHKFQKKYFCEQFSESLLMIV